MPLEFFDLSILILQIINVFIIGDLIKRSDLDLRPVRLAEEQVTSKVR